MYNNNKRGARMDPCGTPDNRGTGGESFPSSTTYWNKVPKGKKLSKKNAPSEGQANANATSGLCCKPFIEDRDEALLCEGSCDRWLHRYCTGITETQYEALQDSPLPFLCFIIIMLSTQTGSSHQRQAGENWLTYSRGNRTFFQNFVTTRDMQSVRKPLMESQVKQLQLWTMFLPIR